MLDATTGRASSLNCVLGGGCTVRPILCSASSINILATGARRAYINNRIAGPIA